MALLFTGSFASVSATGASVWLSSEHGQFFDCPAICEQEGDNATFASMCTTAEFAEAVDTLLDRSTFAWTGIFQWPTNPRINSAREMAGCTTHAAPRLI